MIDGAIQYADRSVLTDDATHGLGEIEVQHPAGTVAVTPASLVSLRAIGIHQKLLSGIGIDWGAGCGVLSIAAARIEAVTKVYGLELVPDNVDVARENARSNGVTHKTEFFRSDSFSPFAATDSETVAALTGNVRFILANPPSSQSDDGFDFRRRILREARNYLTDGGVVFLSISYQYGRRRIARLTNDAPGCTHRDVLVTTDWVPFDLNRPDLLDCLRAYVREEQRGGFEYEFMLPGDPSQEPIGARAAMALYERTGRSPLSKWQTHLIVYHTTK